MPRLNHDGRDVNATTHTKYSFSRDWQLRGHTLWIAGGSFRNITRLKTGDDKASDAALASAELKNVLAARIEGIRALYANIARDAGTQM